MDKRSIHRVIVNGILSRKAASRMLSVFLIVCLLASGIVLTGAPWSVKGSYPAYALDSSGGNSTVRYPDVLMDKYSKFEGGKADFELTESSRFYVVTDGDEADKISKDASESTMPSEQADTIEEPDDAADDSGEPAETAEMIKSSGALDASDRGDEVYGLYDTVALIDSKFSELAIPDSKPLLVFYGSEEFTMPGDIVVKLVSGDPSQNYRMEVTDKVTITSTSTDGIYYGLLTLLELAIKNTAKEEVYSYYYSEEQAESDEPSGPVRLKSFTMEDGPDLEERAIFLDCGRKYFTPEWIRSLIRRSSMQRYNTLILHFSEAAGLRLDSRVFPWLTTEIDSLSMNEMRDIVQFANRYHMKVIPSFDVPGHNKFIIDRYSSYVSENPDFTFEYEGKTYGPVSGDDADAANVEEFASIANHYTHNGYTYESNSIGIDLTKKHAVAFLDALIDDYAEFFRDLGCTDFDIGGDEVLGYASFNIGGDLLRHENRWEFVEHWADYAQGVMRIPGGSASDTYIHYLNRTALRLMSMGYTCRVFNDEIDVNQDQHFKLLPSIEISYWNAGRRSAKHFAGQGHKLYNCISRWCYFASGRADGLDIMNGKYYSVNGPNIYDYWDPYSYSSNSYNPKPIDPKSCGGAYFCIWCDEPNYRSEENIFAETEMRTWANSAKSWNSRHTDTQAASDTAETVESTFSYYDLESFAGLIGRTAGYSWYESEYHPLNGSGKPLSGEDWWKLFPNLH